MRKYLTMALVGAVLLGMGSVAMANTCAFDNAPAATLLFPFVAYNYTDGADGTNTLFTVTNTSSEAQIVHITVWTDFSIAILDFNILLTGYDVQPMDIRTILGLGRLPVTLVEEHLTNEGIVDDGPLSAANEFSPVDPYNPDDPQPTLPYLNSRCPPTSQAYPGKYVTPIQSNILALFEGWLTSSQVVPRYHDNCDAAPYVPSPEPWFEARTSADDTWMYITADVVENCNTLFPDEAGYFGDGGQIRYDNVLMGDTLWVNNTERFSEGANAVHLEADFALPFIGTIAPTYEPFSFYHRYSIVGQQVESDYREPLPTAWAFRFLNDPANGLSSYLRVFKASSVNAVVPDLYRLSPDETPSELWAKNCLAYTYYAWDEDENVTTTQTMPWSMPGGETVILNLLPLETQEVAVDQFNILDGSGWMLFVWPYSNWNEPLPSTFDNFDFYQTWMGVKYVKEGDYSAFIPGAVMANFNCFSDQVLPYLGWNDSNWYYSE